MKKICIKKRNLVILKIGDNMLIFCIILVFLFFLFSYFHNIEIINDEIINEYFEEQEKN